MTNGLKACSWWSVHSILSHVEWLMSTLPYTKEQAKKVIFKKTSNEWLFVDKRHDNVYFKITFETKENGETVVTNYQHSSAVNDESNLLIRLFKEDTKIWKEVEGILNHYYNIYQMSKNWLLEDGE